MIFFWLGKLPSVKKWNNQTKEIIGFAFFRSSIQLPYDIHTIADHITFKLYNIFSKAFTKKTTIERVWSYWKNCLLLFVSKTIHIFVLDKSLFFHLISFWLDNSLFFWLNCFFVCLDFSLSLDKSFKFVLSVA